MRLILSCLWMSLCNQNDYGYAALRELPAQAVQQFWLGLLEGGIDYQYPGLRWRYSAKHDPWQNLR